MSIEQPTPRAMRIEAVIFDWAGTLIDFGSCAPTEAFLQAFAQFGVSLSPAQARGPMGLGKLEHIRALGALDPVREAWRTAHGRAFDDAEAQAVYAVFEPLNARIAIDRAALVPGAAAVCAWLRARGCRIGSTTGYPRAVMDAVLPRVKAQGFEPDHLVCADDRFAGRPSAVMMWESFLSLEVDDAAKAVKVDDTPAGLAEGLAAGSWTVGVTLSGNEIGLPVDELAGLEAHERDALNAAARARLRDAGAHFVIDTVAGLPQVIEAIDAALARGERPPTR